MKTAITRIAELRALEVAGPYRWERVVPWDWEKKQRGRLSDEFQLELPSRRKLNGFGEPEELGVFCGRLTVAAVLPDSQWFQWEFRPGFITDFASVPRYFRSIVDNDGLRILAPALPHDRNFSCHDLSFEETNRLFHLMLLKNGYHPARAKLAYWAVSSFVGERRWKSNMERRCEWTLLTSSFATSRT